MQSLDSKITCIIPVFNGAATLRQAVDSCLGQSGVGIVIVDDCSTDRSHALALDIAKAAPDRVGVLKNAANQGPAFSRNRGAFMATGNFLCFLDADDWYLPGFFEKPAAILAGNETIAAVKTSIRVQDAGGAYKLSPGDPRLENVMVSSPCNMVIRREVFLALGGFPIDPRFRGPLGGEDDCFFTALRAFFRCFQLPEELFVYNSKPGDHLDRFLSRSRVENGEVIFREDAPQDADQVARVVQAQQEFLERARRNLASVERCRLT